MNRNYKVIWNASLNCFMAVSEYAKARGKSSKSSVSSNATINTTSTLSSTNAFRLTAIGLGLMAAGLTMSPQVFAVTGVGGAVDTGVTNCGTNASAGKIGSVAVGCNSVADLSADPAVNFYQRGNPDNLAIDISTAFNSTAVGTGARATEAGTSLGMNAESRNLGVALGIQAKSENVAALAIGPAALAKGNTSLALGRQSAATQDFAQAIGNVASATGKGSLAVGHSARAEGYRSIAIGSADIDGAEGTGTTQPGVKYQTNQQTLAKGIDSIAFGSGAKATATNAIAVGTNSEVTGDNTVSVGWNSGVGSNQSEGVSIGNRSGQNVLSNGNVALGLDAGSNVQATPRNTVTPGVAAYRPFTIVGQNTGIGAAAGYSVYGDSNSALGERAGRQVDGHANTAVGAFSGNNVIGSANIAMGANAGVIVKGDRNTAIGNFAGANVDGNVNSAFGNGAGIDVKGGYNLALGAGAGAGINSKESVAIGNNAGNIAKGNVGEYSISVGTNSSAQGLNSMAIGRGTVSAGENATGIGVQAKAEAKNSVAIGQKAKAKGISSLAIGDGAEAEGINSIAIGTGSRVTGDNSGAFGDPNIVSGTGSYAVGNNNTISNNNTFVLGNDAVTTQDNSIVLGNLSTDRAATTETGITINTIPYTYAGQGSAVKGVVSVGKVGSERQIINVAAGEVSPTSTDAINGSQLNATNESIVDLSTTVITNKTKYYSVSSTAAGAGSNANNDGATKPNAMAMGGNASATGGQAIAIGSGDSGQNTTASGEQSIAIGANVQSSGNSSIAIGGDDLDDASKVSGVNALYDTYTGGIGGLVAVGDYSGHTKSDGAASVAIGVKARSDGDLSTAIGVRSSSSGKASSAFGMGSSANAEGSVALGAGSVANRAGAGGGYAAYTGGVTGNALTDINNTIGRVEFGAVSVGTGREGGNRQIINVAAGSLDSDAVNVAQLKGVDGKVKKGLNFTGDKTTTVINRQLGDTLTIKGGESNVSKLASGNNIGVVANGNDLDIKLSKDLTGLSSATFGNTVINTGGVTFLGGSTVSLSGTGLNNGGNVITNVASGGTTLTNAANIGDLNTAVAANKTKYYSVSSTAAGAGSNANNDGATKPNAMAMGGNASATGGQAIAIGSGDSGQNTTASGEQSIAIGANVQSSGNSSIAIGGDDLDDASKVSGVNALYDTYTGGIGGLVAVGDYSGHTKSDGAASVAIGVKARSDGDLSTAIGVRSSSSGKASSAFGMGSSANAEGSVALGAGSVANRAGAGGGYAAYTGGVTGNALTDINNTIGRVEFGAVSVGTGREGGNRQIINVAAGSLDSDAVNVAQLKGVQAYSEQGFDITADNASLASDETKDKVKLGETVKYTSADGSIVTTVADNEIDFALGDNLSVGGAGQDGEDGEDGFIGVNGADGLSGIALNGANGTIGLTGPTGASGTIGVINGVPGVNGVDGITRIVIDDIQVATMEDGMKFAGNTGGTIAKKLNETLNIEGTLTNSADASGANLRVDSDNGKLNLVMAKNLMDLDSIMINNGGPIISSTGIDMGSNADNEGYPTNRITNLGKGIAGTDAVNRDQLEELTTDLTDLGLNFGGDSGTDVNRKLGQKLIVKGGDTINADPTTKNISVTANGDDTLTVRLAKDINLGETGSVTTGNTQVNNAGITLYRGDNGLVALTNNGLNNGNNKITNVADGLLSATSMDGVNGSQLFKTNQEVAKGIKFELNGTTKTYALGEAIQVATDANITTTAFGNGAKFGLADTIKVGGTSANAVSIDGTAGIVKGLTNTTFDASTTYTGGQAATQEQLSGLQNGISNTFDKGISFGGDNAPTTIKRKLGEKIIVKGGVSDSTKLTDSNIGVIADGTDTLTVKLAKDLTGLNSASFGNDVMISSTGLRAGTTVINTGGVSFSGSTVGLSGTGLNNGGNVITNVARGEATTDAVNVGQLNEVKQSAADANKGWNVSAQGANTSTVKPSDTVDLNNTDNNITVSKTAESNNVSFNLSKDIAVDSVKTGDATINSSGLTIVGGPKFTKTSVDAGGNKITNVAKGDIEFDSNDAVNGSQLFEFLSLVNTQTTVIAEMGAGLNFNADIGPVINKKTGSTPLTLKGGKNITTTSENGSIKFDLNGNINVDSVTTGDTNVSTNGVVIAGGPSITKTGIYAGNGETAPSMTAAGINAAGTKVTNVADGMAPRDAVNFGQLDAVSRGLGNSINELGYKIGEVEDDANAGISAAMAMSSLPQAYIIGKPMIGGGIATFNGESAVAIGFSKMSNDGRWVMKLNGTADTQGNVGAAIGAGFHFD